MLPLLTSIIRTTTGNAPAIDLYYQNYTTGNATATDFYTMITTTGHAPVTDLYYI